MTKDEDITSFMYGTPPKKYIMSGICKPDLFSITLTFLKATICQTGLHNAMLTILSENVRHDRMEKHRYPVSRELGQQYLTQYLGGRRSSPAVMIQARILGLC